MGTVSHYFSMASYIIVYNNGDPFDPADYEDTFYVKDSRPTKKLHRSAPEATDSEATITDKYDGDGGDDYRCDATSKDATSKDATSKDATMKGLESPRDDPPKTTTRGKMGAFPLIVWHSSGVTPYGCLVKFGASGEQLFTISQDGISDVKGTTRHQTWGAWLKAVNAARQRADVLAGRPAVNKKGANMLNAMYISHDAGATFKCLRNTLASLELECSEGCFTKRM